MKRSAARDDHQLTFGPTPANDNENRRTDLKKIENGDLSSALKAAGVLIEQARERAGLTRKEACALMFISEPQYSRWTSGAANDTASLARLLLLPPSFWFHLNQSLNERFGLRRMIAAQLLGAAADFVLAESR